MERANSQSTHTIKCLSFLRQIDLFVSHAESRGYLLPSRPFSHLPIVISPGELLISLSEETRPKVGGPICWLNSKRANERNHWTARAAGAQTNARAGAPSERVFVLPPVVMVTAISCLSLAARLVRRKC